MSVRQEEAFVAPAGEELDQSERLTWVRPEVRRLAAGSAEDGGGMNPDSGFNPS